MLGLLQGNLTCKLECYLELNVLKGTMKVRKCCLPLQNFRFILSVYMLKADEKSLITWNGKNLYQANIYDCKNCTIGTSTFILFIRIIGKLYTYLIPSKRTHRQTQTETNGRNRTKLMGTPDMGRGSCR